MIYVLRAVHPHPNVFIFKIGFFDRSDVRARAKEISKNNSVPVIEYLQFEGTEEEEKMLHQAFRRYRFKQEYFNMTSLFSKCRTKEDAYNLFEELIDIVLPDRIVKTCYLPDHIRTFLYENYSCYPSEPESPQDMPSLKEVYEQYLAYCVVNQYLACSLYEFKQFLLNEANIGAKTFNAQKRMNMKVKPNAKIKRL